MDTKLLTILKDLQPEVDFETCTTLIDDHYLDSMQIISLVTDLEEEFDILIPTVEIIPDNFNSAEKIWEMITRLRGER